MNIASYTYQSPSTTAIQVGRLDPSSVKESEKPQENTEKNNNDMLTSSTNETQQNAQSFLATQVTDVKPTVSSQNSLDLYA